MMPHMTGPTTAKIPRHVALIMDGNGRWAEARGLPRSAGHKAGIDALRRALRAAADFGIEYLSIYSFSTENWKRPKTEVDMLMSLLREYIQRELAEIHKNNIQLRIIGHYELLPNEVRQDLDEAIELTSRNTGMVLSVALNYSARTELVDAFNKIRKGIHEGTMPDEEITEETISKHLYTQGLPDPDLLIRTSGEMRVSNFLLWQIAYSEIWVTETCWPDFKRRDLLQAVIDFQKRERRYGGLGRNGS
jgi:undecaprenyl diphosphate synthase